MGALFWDNYHPRRGDSLDTIIPFYLIAPLNSLPSCGVGDNNGGAVNGDAVALAGKREKNINYSGNFHEAKENLICEKGKIIVSLIFRIK